MTGGRLRRVCLRVGVVHDAVHDPAHHIVRTFIIFVHVIHVILVILVILILDIVPVHRVDVHLVVLRAALVVVLGL